MGLQEDAAAGARIVQDLEHQVAVAIAGAVRQALGHDLVGLALDVGDLVGGEEAADDGVAVLAQMLDVVCAHGCSRMVGSCATGKFTERAMKHILWASACNARAFARSAPGFTVTSGFSTTAVKLAAAVGLLDHGAFGAVDIGGDDDAGDGTEVQVPEHVAGRERGDQQLLRIVAGGIAAEARIGGAGDRRLAGDADLVRPRIGGVGAGARALVAGPVDGDGVVMLLWHLSGAARRSAAG